MRGSSLRRARGLADSLLVLVIQLTVVAMIVVGIYALVVLGIGSVPSSHQWTLLAFSALAAGIAAVTYARVRASVGAWAATLVRRERPAPADVARMFSKRAAGGLTLDELLPALLESMRIGLGLTVAEVWISSGGVLQLAASEPRGSRAAVMIGERESDLLIRAGTVGRSWLGLWLPAIAANRDDVQLRAAPMVHGEELIGLLLAERDAGQGFDREDDEALALLARQAALALRNVSLGSALDASMEELRRHAAALRESRARVVTAADAERRRIERDLHDGAQQHLLGLAVNLKVARELAGSDPVRAESILAELSDEVHAALEELRELAHGIYPPLLVERGLADAVRAALRRSGVRGRVDADGIGRYQADAEATAYFCCVEAIQNAAKHAPAATVDVRLWTADGALYFAVSDDGPGFDPDVTPEGAGLTNMRDRVGALGGSLQLDGQPQAGTRVTGAVPLVSGSVRPDTAGLP